jgi:hypothetical protein
MRAGQIEQPQGRQRHVHTVLTKSLFLLLELLVLTIWPRRLLLLLLLPGAVSVAHGWLEDREEAALAGGAP